MASEGSKAANDAPDGTKTIDEEQLPSKEDILALVNKIDDPETLFTLGVVVGAG